MRLALSHQRDQGVDCDFSKAAALYQPASNIFFRRKGPFFSLRCVNVDPASCETFFRRLGCASEQMSGLLKILRHTQSVFEKLSRPTPPTHNCVHNCVGGVSVWIFFLENDLDVPKDLEKATVLHERAAERGDIDSSARLGCMTSNVRGIVSHAPLTEAARQAC